MAGADLKELSVGLLASGTVGMQTGDGKTTVYTVPTGKKAIIIYCIARNPTASLAGGTDYDVGDGAAADTWRTAIDLSSMTATSDHMILAPPTTKLTVFDAGDAFGVKPITGSTADADCTWDVFGYEWAV